MRLLGMKYETERKSFYVDGHEREDVVDYRIWFVNTYLNREWEPHCLRFVQLSPEQDAKIPNLAKADCLKIVCEDGSHCFEVREDRLHKLGEAIL